MKKNSSLLLLFCYILILATEISCTKETSILDEQGLKVSTPTLFVEIGKKASISIEGNGGYSVSTKDTKIIRTKLKGSELVVEGLKEGNADISITDKDDQYLTVEVVVGDIGTRETDSLALIDLYVNTHPESWVKRWQINFPIQYWEGVKVNEDGRVVELNLKANGLSGTLPVSISKLFYLKKLDLSYNKFSNELPSEISKLINLTYLRLEFMKGLLISPTTVEKLTRLRHLKYLGLMDMNLTAPMKPILDKFTSLNTLVLGFYNQNKFPLEVCNLTNLRSLEIWNGNFGTLPAELSKLTNLTSLVMPNDGITGEIPPELGRMTNLQTLNLSENKLVGSIPSTFNQLTHLTSLILYQNALTGLPEDMSGMKNLSYLTIRNNKLRSPLPRLDGLSHLFFIGLENNEITGGIPPSWATLTSLKTLKLSYNRITGNVPDFFGALTHLRILRLNNNNFTGTVPVSFANFRANDQNDIFVIDLRSNKMSGTLDETLRSHPMYLNDRWVFSPQQQGYGFDDISKIFE